MTNWKILLLLTFLNLFASFAFASNQATEPNLGSNHIIDSQIFGEERRIQIYLPDGYKNSSKEYPVMYVMDGDWYFLHGVSYQKSLSYIDHSPEYIVVGINTDPNLFKRQSFFRTKEFQLKRSKLTNYLTKEVIPFVEKQFRVTNERIYFGWEIAGLLGVDIFTQHTELFTGYILASPTPLLDDQLEEIEKALKSETMKNKFIYFSSSPAETWTTRQTNKLAKLLKEKAPKSLKWKYVLLEGEDHYSTPIPSVYQGLKAYFSDYFPIRFSSLKEFNDFGGLMQLSAHYKQRGNRYGVSTDIHADTVHTLFMESSNEDNIEAFETFFKTFSGHFETYAYYPEDFYTLLHGESCLKHKKIDLAIEVFNTGLKRFPDSAKLHNGLGDAYSLKKEIKEAAKYYKKAIALAKTNADSDLAKYEVNLSKLAK